MSEGGEDATGEESDNESETHSANECAPPSLINSQSNCFKDRLLGFRIAEGNVLERNQVPGRSKFGGLA